jgi:hypothetical protein
MELHVVVFPAALLADVKGAWRLLIKRQMAAAGAREAFIHSGHCDCGFRLEAAREVRSSDAVAVGGQGEMARTVISAFCGMRLYIPASL